LRKPFAPPVAALAAVLLLIATALVACGDGGGGGEDVDKVLDQTFRSEQKLNSGRLTLDATARLEGAAQLSGPVSIKMSGPFDGLEKKIAETGQIPKADLEISASAAGQDFSAGFTSTGDKLFVNFRGTDYVVPEGQLRRLKRQLERAQAEDARTKSPDLATLGIKPNDWLKDASDEGTEDVGGTETIHIKGGVDVPKMLDDFDRLLKQAGKLNLSREQLNQLPQGIPQSTRDQIEKAVEKAELDIYTGKDDKVLRKLETKVQFTVPEDLRQQAGGLQSGEIELSLEITDVNEPQTIDEPKSAKPLSQLQRQLGTSGFGALGSQGGSGGSSSPGGGGSQNGATPGGSNVSPTQSRRYLRCVQRAKGQDELNRCSEILR
jgi:hypothetical protein